jgi:hypothetical protein
VEYGISSQGGSGEQWDTWEAMFSHRDGTSGFPLQLFDGVTGAIHPDVADQWRSYDISKIVAGDWARFGPIVTQRVRLACGTEDTFYLNNAVKLFKDEVERLNGGSLDDDDAPGYILLVEGADHGSVSRATGTRWNREMREHLARHKLLFIESATQE